MSDTTDNALDEKEQIALRGTSEASVLIRKLASAPISAESQKMIRDLAGAFHNAPRHCAAPKQQRHATAFLIDAALQQAAKTCLDHRFEFAPAHNFA